MQEFLHMGGYAFYVWMSYGITAMVMVANLALPLLRRRRLMNELTRKTRARSAA
jgi:heme exporter protein D